MLGKTSWKHEHQQMSSMMAPYQNLDNLHFVGHVEGEEKNNYLKRAKILVNTSIHEGIPVSFIEALSFGTALVSCNNPEDLTSKFGISTGRIYGSGFDKVDLLTQGVETLMEDESHRQKIAEAAVSYVKKNHNIQLFQEVLRQEITELHQSYS